MPLPRRAPLAALGAVVVLVGAGCATGPRPTLGPVDPAGIGTTTGVPAVDDLLRRLDAVETQTFTAKYHITRKLGPVSRDATVVVQARTVSATVGDIRYLHSQAGGDQTCSMTSQTCDEGTLDQRISDLGVTSGFYGPAVARMIRLSMARRDGTPTTSTAQITGITADCIGIPLGGGTESYCVLTSGALAKVDRADVAIDLTSFSPEADASALSAPGSGDDAAATVDTDAPDTVGAPDTSGG